MSAKTEILIERINKLRNAIVEIEERGEDSHSTRQVLEKCLQELHVANHTLNEGKTLLKG